VARAGYFLEIPVADFERAMAVNYFGTLYAVRAVLPAMRKQKDGCIINVASRTYFLANPGQMAYVASKGAVMGIDILTTKPSGRAALVLSQHPRLDMAGYVARKLIAAEPFLEHGLSLALTLVEVVSLAPALERD